MLLQQAQHWGTAANHRNQTQFFEVGLLGWQRLSVCKKAKESNLGSFSHLLLLSLRNAFILLWQHSSLVFSVLWRLEQVFLAPLHQLAACAGGQTLQQHTRPYLQLVTAQSETLRCKSGGNLTWRHAGNREPAGNCWHFTHQKTWVE